MATITVDRSINADEAFAMSAGTCFVALPTGSTTYQSNPTGYSTWVTGTIVQSSNWQSVCYGNNIVVAVSSTSGTIAASSPAGVTATWTLRTMPATASWYAVAYGLSKFVAVTGGASTAGAYSADGAVWTSTGALTTSGDWRALTFGNDRFVTLSYNSTNSNYSTNGTSWNAGGALPGTRNWTSITYGEGTFVAVASGNASGAYSTDGGVTWNDTTMPSAASWTSVTYGNGTFVAVATGPSTTAAYSADGITWTAATLPNSRSWVGVAFGNNVFTAIASGSTSGGAFSYDGISWQAITTLSQTVACIAYTPTTWNSNDTLVITNNSTVTVNTDQKKFWNQITLTNGKLLITNSSTSTGIRFVMGRVTGATASSITPGSGIGDVEISGDWIELGTGDGTSGQTMTAPFSDYISTLWVETASGSGVYEVWLNATGAYGDTTPTLVNGLSAVGKTERGKFFIQQAETDPYGPTIITGTSGSLAQKLIDVSSTTGLYAGASVFGPGIPANTVVNRVISSTQLELNANTTTAVSPDWTSVAYGNSTYVAISGAYSNVAATSADGVTWTKRTLPFIADWTGITYGATSALFVAVASHGVYGVGYCATSPDGITWTQRAMPTLMNYNAVASNGTSFVAVGATAANAVTTIGAYSADGITWSATTMSSQIWNAVGYGGGRYVAVGTGTVSNYDADGSGTWSNGATLTSATYRGLAYNGTRWVAVSGSTSGSQYKDDPTTGAFTAGGTLNNATSRGIAWDGTNFVVVSTTNSVNTSRSTNGVSWTHTTMAAANANNWTAICANGTTLVAVSSSSNLRSAAITSTDSGANWTLQTGTPTEFSLTCFNPYQAQLTNTVQFGDNSNGNKVPTGAKVRCPNIMITNQTPANIQTASRIVGTNLGTSAAAGFVGGSVSASICLFDESYNYFNQAETVSLTNVGFTLVPLINECYDVNINGVGFALEPVRRYYQFSATLGSNGWFTRDSRFGSAYNTNIWTYINGASITNLNVAVGNPYPLVLATGAGSVSAPNAALQVQYTEDSTWTNIRFYGLCTVRNFQTALSLSPQFNTNTITDLESYSLSPFFLGTSIGNTITGITYSEDMFNGYKIFATGARIGVDPIAEAHLEDDTKYYLKVRTFSDWTNRAIYAESREYSATPYLGYAYHPQSFSAVNTATRLITLNWVRREPTSATVAYTIFRGTSPGFTRNSASRIFYTPTSTVVAYANGYVATATGSGGRTLTFAAAGRTITASSGSFVTDGFVIGMNVVVAGTTSNNGTYMIATVAATVLTLATNHTNLVNEGPISTGTLDGQAPSNATTYYYRMHKYEAANSGITNAAGTGAATTLTIPSGNFNTGLGTVINCEGVAGSNKVRLPIGSTTNFLAANVCPGMKISGGGVGSNATIVSIDTPWQITLSVVNDSTFSGQTLSKGAATGMYIYGPGIAWPTKVVTVDSDTQITVDTAFLATFTGQTITFMYGSESSEVQAYCSGPNAAAFNFLTYSDVFSNAAWVATNATIANDQRVAPTQIPYAAAASITGVADRMLSTGPNAKIVQTVTDLESGQSYNFSVYVMTDPNAYYSTVAGEISINTTSPTTQAFTATGLWQRISTAFTATSSTHTFTIQINKEGAYIFLATANVVPGSSVLQPITNTTVKKAAGSGGRTLTFASSGTVHTITASSGSFSTDGFVAGDSIIVSGTTSNDGQYVLSAVAATILTITPAQPLVAEGPISVGYITGSVLAMVANELTLAAAWSRSLGGNDTNQGVELTVATAPTNSFFSEIYLGTSSGFTPTDYNRVAYIVQPGSHAPISLSNSSNNRISDFSQVGYGGISGALLTLVGSSDNNFQNFTADFNYSLNTAKVISATAQSNNNVFDDFTISNWRNYISTWSPLTLLNNASGLTLSNFVFNHYDIPYYISATDSALGVVMKGVSGGGANAITTATTYALGSTLDGVGISFTAVYDTMFHEMFTSPTAGALSLRFNASVAETPPYTILSGSPAFSNTGRLYFRTAGDSIEITWPHRIYTVSGFKDLLPKFSSLDLGHTSSLDAAFSIKLEYSIDTGSGYGAYKVATPTNLASESVSTTTGFFIKLKLTARPGMMFSTQTNAFVVGETIEGTTSGATAVVDELYQLTTTTGSIILSSVTGTFLPAELVRRASDNQTRATNVVTNTQFALFPSFNSYVDGLEIYTNTVDPGDYPGTTVSVVLTNVVSGSTYYVFKTADQTLLGSGTAASSTVTIPGIAYVADFGITVRVRKATAATKYIPLETQATVNSAGASVYIGQLEDSIVGASVNGTIAGDFTVNTTTKTIKHTADTVVYTVNELYTWLMDYFDDVSTIDDTVPISAQTPTEYTLTNGWFIDNASFKYLSGGAIQTDGQDSYRTHIITVTGGTYADPIAGDITKTVMAGATSIGPLLDYEIISAGVSSKWYVRDTRTVPAQIASATAMTITTGTGSGNNSANSLTGENIWSNIFTLGTIVSGTTLDLYQNDSQITPWWSTGQIDILVKVREAGVEIDSGNLTVLARKYATLYDHYVIDASTGRNPVPLAAFNDTSNETVEGTVGAYTGFTFDFGATSKDLGNGNGAQPYDCIVDCDDHTIQEVYEYLKYVTRTGSGTTLNSVNGEYYQAVGDIRLNYTGEASGPFVEGNVITSSGGGTGYIVSLIDSGATGTLVVRNVHGTFADTNTLTSSGTTATISGTPDTILQSKQAPFGTFSGGKFFGARGVWLDNVASADSINYQLIDSLGVTQIPPISITVTVKDANTLAAVESARVLLEASAGGDLPAGASCTITRSGATATVSHTAHNMTTGMSVIIRGATQDEYNGIFTITVTGVDDYTYTVTGTPATPATGTITATCAILNGATNASGIYQITTFNYTSDQPITGKVRRATTGTKYKTGAITGTITSTGLSTIVLLIIDE